MTNLESIQIPNSVISIGAHAFHDTPWYYEHEDDDAIYINNILYNYNNYSATTYSINEGTVSICDGVF
jgi:hypothetical protein